MKTIKLLLLLLLAATGAQAQTIVERHGQLHVKGAQILDKCDRPAQLKGMSYFWHQWEGSEFWNADAVKWLRDDWKVEIVRAAMGVRGGDDQYDYINNPTYASGQVKKVVDGAIKHGIYVLIDFHAHPNYKAQAKTFFADMSKLYGDKPNVIYEIWNEPIGEYGDPGTKWTEIKDYAKEVIAVIRANDPDGLIVVGTPFYDQFVNTAADSPLTTDSNGKPVGNVAYTLHVYADAHRFDSTVGDNARYALKKGLPMFVTESGATGTDYNQPRSSGKNKPNYTEWKKWEDWWDTNGISYTKWSLSTKDEYGSSLNPGASATGNWDYTKDLTDEGRWNRDHFRAVNTLPDACSGGGGTTPSKDAVGSVTAPSSVSPGEKVTVSVDYSAKQDCDLKVYFQLAASPYTLYGSSKVAVKAGSGTAKVELTIDANTPLADKAYTFQSFLTPTGKSWAERLANLKTTGVSVVAQAATTADNIYTEGFASGWADWSWSGTATPADPLTHSGSKAFKFVFSGSGAVSFEHNVGKTGEQLVGLEFWARTYTGNANFQVSASYDDDFAHASAAKTIAVTPTYQKFSLSKADLGNFGWYRRLFIQGTGGSLFIDDVKLIYSATTSARPATTAAPTLAATQAPHSLGRLRVYPNPSTGEFYFELPPAAAKQPVRATLYDKVGRMVLTRPLAVPAGSSAASLDVRSAGLPQGAYLLRVETTDGQPLGTAPLLLH